MAGAFETGCAVLRQPRDDLDQIYNAGIDEETRKEATQVESAWDRFAASAAYHEQQEQLRQQIDEERKKSRKRRLSLLLSEAAKLINKMMP